MIYTLHGQEIESFMEGLGEIDFFIPGYEPARHLGEIAIRIYYKDGCSDIYGSNCSYYIDPDGNPLKRSVKYPEKEAFYKLFTQYADSKPLL